MRKSGVLALAALSILFLVGANLATALEPIPEESGFSGFIRPGIGYLDFKSNMVASFLGYDLSDEQIDSLTESPDSQSTGIFMIPFSLEYTFASTRTKLFLGTDLTDLIRFDLSQQAGIKQGIEPAWRDLSARELKKTMFLLIEDERIEGLGETTGGGLLYLGSGHRRNTMLTDDEPSKVVISDEDVFEREEESGFIEGRLRKVDNGGEVYLIIDVDEIHCFGKS